MPTIAIGSLVGDLRWRRRRLRATPRSQSPFKQEARQRSGRRVIEDAGRRQGDIRRRTKSVAQLDGAERLQSELFERRVRVENIGGVTVKRGGNLCQHQLEHELVLGFA